MKNIHILPTDKPSRLYEFGGEYHLQIKSQENFRSQHIYITNDEEIKEGDWCLDIKRNIIFQSKRNEIGTSKKIPIIICTYEGCYIKKDCKKIILTDNKDLIKDGVQAIDDTFLEWFVKNSSCEEVEVCKNPFYEESNYEHYKIIIPQKEDEQEEEEVECNMCDSLMSYDEENGIYICTNSECTRCYEEYEEEPIQETIEEAAKRTYQKGLQDDIDLSFYDGVRFGAKWQEERMYSEEEVLDIINSFEKLCYTYQSNKDWFPAKKSEWFEKFKKK
jgi:hypothetical protein